MPCVSPIKGYRGPDGVVRFSHVGAHVDRHTEVPCGQCVECRLSRSRDWATRCVHEASLHDASCFVTLTYADAFLPSDGSLALRDWTLFRKRVRESIGPFRFLHCGEYGSLFGRPHYHAVLFGVDFRSASCKRSVEDIWEKGRCHVGSASWNSAAYVARYCVKRLPRRPGLDVAGVPDGTGSEGGRRPAYASMSRRPAIGLRWIQRYWKEVYRHDSVVVEGREVRPPKYYDRWMDEHHPEEMELVRRNRVEASAAFAAERTPERRAVREKVKLAKQDVFARKVE